ncbi:hypothetical protein EYC59_01625 [Candidatus Saccharibacteria bacterium]|nr:MAG: hypothetical protein EYC59_01625 [Candidatus Saccharibacteria bacterium]
MKTRTITVPYTSVLAAPSDGNGGYLVDLGNFPANARIISTDLKINAPFTTSDSADVSAQLLLNDNINAGYNYPLGCYSLVSGSTGDNQYSWNGCVNYGSGSGPVLSVAGSLQLGVSGGANLSSLSSGQATIYVHYVKY